MFSEALALPPAERAIFLAKACGTDVALLAELVALLAAHEEPESLTSAHLLTRPALVPEEQPSDWIGRYRLLQKIGEGGCGVVWMAEQEEPVRRRVALKVIKLGMDTKAVIARFEAERQALAMMDHPHIAKVHDAGCTDTGRPYFVMELVRGIPITKYCDEQQLTPAARLELFIKVCQAVQHAHQKGVIHRDLKPSNILVTVNDGQATPKIIDFGIAKATQGRLTDATLFTAFEQFIGTPAYMSPEQAEMSSLDIDTRSDIYSLGVLLYELLTGRQPFDSKRFAGASVDHIRQQIRESEPPRPSARWGTLAEAEQTTVARQRGTLPATLSGLLRGDLDWIVMRCLEKDRTRRYETANGLAMDLQRHLRNEPVVARPPSSAYLLQKLIRRHRVGVAAAGVVLGVVVLGAMATATQATRALRAERQQNELREAARQAQAKEAAARHAAEAAQLRSEKQRLARQHLMPEIDRLMQAFDIAGAFVAALEAEKYLPDDPALTALWPRLSRTITVETTPAGAGVYVKPYLTPKAEWQFLGTTPLKAVRLAKDGYRWQFRLEGHETLERTTGKNANIRTVALDRVGLIPPGMVRVTGVSADPTEPLVFGPDQSEAQAPRVGDFLIDRYEVTNRQFMAFVDGGGYATPTWWKPPFIKAGREIPWAEAVASLRDATGRPGPATWRNGVYPAGEDEYPVAGVSWYEAAAYAESVGKRLPSIFHRRRAARGEAEGIVRLSNFSGLGPAPDGSYQGMSSCGAYDLAGNVKEWCWNEAVPGKRYILGADSREPAYMYTHLDAQSPWDRSPGNGFRCISLPANATLDPRMDAPEAPTTRDFSREQPASDEVFRAFLSHYSYEKTPLNTRIESTDASSESVRKELVSITAAYGGERVPVWLHLPKKGTPPFQAVIFFPGSNALNQRDHVLAPSFIVDSGRALIIPIFKGLYDRGEGPSTRYLNDPNMYSDFVVQCAKDLGRTIDYLETRADIRSDKLAYFGTSLGAAPGSILPAVESRLKACVLVGGGIFPLVVAPHVDQINFAPRIRMPTLMINGRYDFIFTEPSQRQLFRLLGTPTERKQHLVFDVGHAVVGENRTKETLAWLDRYLGPVK
jgi:formylglycine-generating enzyme required for sulfatase activity/tRNA A-37 threonylcarbamoyl transferase component Bud32/cephalosporin-C deacetylase-like acetyl esterase